MKEEFRLVKHKQPGILSFGYYFVLKCAFVFVASLYLCMTFIDYTLIKLYDVIYTSVENWMYHIGELSGDTQEFL